MPEITLGELAQRLQAELHGDPLVIIRGVAPLNTAQSGHLSFLSREDKRHQQYLSKTQASAVILSPGLQECCPTNALLTANPKLSFVTAIQFFYPAPLYKPGIHATALVAKTSSIAETATIGPNCVIGEKVTIGERTVIEAGCFIGEDTWIGADCHLWPNVTVYGDTRIGNRVLIHSGTVIASDGFGFVQDDGKWHKIPQVGRVIIGDDVEIGANTTVDRGALEDTVIEEGVKIDNQVQIAHNVKIGAHTIIAGCVGIAGSTKIGRHCMIGGAVGIADHVEIVDHVCLAGMTGVGKSILKPGLYASGVSLREYREWRRNASKFYQLADMAQRIAKLEDQMGGYLHSGDLDEHQ